MQFIGQGWSFDYGCDVKLYDCQMCSASKRVPVANAAYTPIGAEGKDEFCECAVCLMQLVNATK